MAITSLPSASLITIGRLTIAPVPRIADCGGTKIGVSNSAPTEPVLVMVKVPPDSSSGPILLSRVRLARSAILRAMPADVQVVGALDHRHDQPARGVDGDARG